MDFRLPFQTDHLPFLIVAIFLAFTVHEYAHARLAYRFGDPTAYKLGRVTLNPMSHVSLLGILFILFLGFGWARPVPVDRSHFRNPRLMSIVVSAAGPISNLVVGVVAAVAAYALFATGWVDQTSPGVYRAAGLVFFYIVHINLLLFIFNLIPLPPLDGYRIVEDLAPRRLRLQMMKYEPWGVYIFLLIVFITPVFNLTIGPILGQVVAWRQLLFAFLSVTFGTRIDWGFVYEG
ncbi:site-2 protease family protein [Paenibacillus sp.]|uniref:site-2 protease family protein n=1 Tax=Paenibacillus sp. TaxID=58172 RepID=UPI002D595E4C|nr:site-2 protease family protein [Paenibacillus sp.]HZG57390.1 site-2 protease family protein [Paenibacillus sp.]